MSLGILSGHASAVANTTTNTANTLKVSPVRSDIEVPAGASKSVKMTVTNLTNATIVLHPVENDFVAGDEKGTPSLILDDTKYAPTHSLKRFMQPMSDVTIPAKQAKDVETTIVVPKGAQAGGYFGAVRFEPTSPDGGGQVNLSASVASLILMTVPGNMVEKLNLTTFDIQQGSKTGTLFQTPNNLQVAFRLENKGSVQEGPFGQVTVQKGKTVVWSQDFNVTNPREMILPDSARRWTIPLNKIDTFGHYKVTATFTYGKANQTIQVDQSFWVIPLAFMIGGIIGLIVLVGLIVAIVFGLRGYKRRILRSSRHGGYRR